jgi:hypothetical protein
MGERDRRAKYQRDRRLARRPDARRSETGGSITCSPLGKGEEPKIKVKSTEDLSYNWGFLTTETVVL